MRYSYLVIVAILLIFASLIHYVFFSNESAIYYAIVALFTLKLSDRE